MGGCDSRGFHDWLFRVDACVLVNICAHGAPPGLWRAPFDCLAMFLFCLTHPIEGDARPNAAFRQGAPWIIRVSDARRVAWRKEIPVNEKRAGARWVSSRPPVCHGACAVECWISLPLYERAHCPGSCAVCRTIARRGGYRIRPSFCSQRFSLRPFAPPYSFFLVFFAVAFDDEVPSRVIDWNVACHCGRVEALWPRRDSAPASLSSVNLNLPSRLFMRSSGARGGDGPLPA